MGLINFFYVFLFIHPNIHTCCRYSNTRLPLAIPPPPQRPQYHICWSFAYLIGQYPMIPEKKKLHLSPLWENIWYSLKNWWYANEVSIRKLPVTHVLPCDWLKLSLSRDWISWPIFHAHVQCRITFDYYWPSFQNSRATLMPSANRYLLITRHFTFLSSISEIP